MIGLNAPLKNHCLALDIFGAQFSKPSHFVIKESALEKKWPCFKNYAI